MEITVLVETLPTQGFRATSLAPSGFVAEAPTRDEALAQLDHLVKAYSQRRRRNVAPERFGPPGAEGSDGVAA